MEKLIVQLSATEAYKTVDDFLDASCMVSKDAEVLAARLCGDYQAFCDSHCVNLGNPTAFAIHHMTSPSMVPSVYLPNQMDYQGTIFYPMTRRTMATMVRTLLLPPPMKAMRNVD